MKRLMSFILLAVALILTGCASDYDKYSEAMAGHSTNESNRISDQAESIQRIVAGTPTKTDNEKMLLAVIGMMTIEDLVFIPLGMKAPTTWADVGESFVSTLPVLGLTYGLWKTAETGIERAAATTFNGDSYMTDSFNRPEVHTTGSGNTSNYTGTTPGAEPVVIGGP